MFNAVGFTRVLAGRSVHSVRNGLDNRDSSERVDLSTKAKPRRGEKVRIFALCPLATSDRQHHDVEHFGPARCRIVWQNGLDEEHFGVRRSPTAYGLENLG